MSPVLAALFLGAASAPEGVERWSAHISEASARFGVPESWIRSVMRAESGGRTILNGRPVESVKGAQGLMQVMPATWRDLRSRYGLGADPHDPRDNILAGTAYLREMHERFGYPGLFAAYNAGPGRYAEHLSRGRRLPRETIAYVEAVAGGNPDGVAPAEPPQPTLLVALSPRTPANADAGTSPSERRSSLLFRLSPEAGWLDELDRRDFGAVVETEDHLSAPVD